MRHFNLEYYPAHEYNKLQDEFYNYKQQSIAELSQYKAAFEAAQKKRLIWDESHGYDFEQDKVYILFNSHTDEIFFSVGPPCFNCTHYIIGNNIPKP
jgi:hypothetical protein